MDLWTGKIYDFQEEDQKEKFAKLARSLAGGARECIQGRLIELEHKPRPGCSRCHGRGYTARNLETGLYIPCKCVGKTRAVKEQTETKGEV